MSSFNILKSGTVVFVGWQTMVVLEVQGAQAVLCPLVYDDEAVHRADVDLEWSELIEAGLTRVGVRCRAIPCCRDTRKLKILGQIGSGALARIKPAAVIEQKKRMMERCAEQKYQPAAPYGGHRQQARRAKASAEAWQVHAMARRVN
ncbi:hypothetical protein AA106555_1901 [Neokomagataea thailandica NBRC 106555]|uniref:Uncharacterized protein n=2 Tax=Neokomagataea TaxID=1223423 RepID=A0A4Y6V344_9PROT|nr:MULTISPECIES: hypothetical protein [Neokomagataea]QDH24459.1 hypothetical protein D5366_03505 [Neokomagataea tanensis]GBR55007.1 hypothetical protein AA106555_1901 [Neokomagataea thailandica NBRC 106555]